MPTEIDEEILQQIKENNLYMVWIRESRAAENQFQTTGMCVPCEYMYIQEECL
jgi:hypothetical protein